MRSESAGDFLLALNSAEGLLQAVLGRREKEAYILVAYGEIQAPAQGAEKLTPLIRQIFVEGGLEAGHLERIAAVRGPGGFTGLRLGPVTAAGLARATGAVQAGIDYLPLLAQSARQVYGKHPACERGDLWAIVHARRNLVYAQAFAGPESTVVLNAAGSATQLRAKASASQSPGPRALSELLILPPSELALLVAAYAAKSAAPPLLLGSGLDKNREEFARILCAQAGKFPRAQARLLPPEYSRPLPEALLDMAVSLEYGTADIDPFYARPADAEEKLEDIALSLGLDPVAARARYQSLSKQRPGGSGSF
ncbi:MAG: tRNA (adenosine(37)-N6)-threonylcarbamoyltransferase complex dimerization subunit type 1 TsaB [Desulfovibrio sp.]|jgi:tRNA threonylcarbamoyl adenosine modification protein YeaZ|nr:tRNA (adenosine(37)-N6)-threonylcarbamoyltransferase complex dimerization subunit type 1 TsaB [Desulfovibrio sp.]